ncbi:unnamed protein product [Mytilus coruscus]|uniref:Reverse transcriptase/retrotransposon-derived protein RNase H-like domain-containing protein n=1 Tax=Mytilus coruscus TaxID=42192 RepID=A0A6J8ECZ9_MYTCO|nr:unnamed protein product [Mytilus coruscus]
MCQNSSHLLKSGLLISKAVVTVNSHKTVPIKLLNPTNDQIFISRGDIIASFEPFTEDYMLINADEKGKHFVQNVQLDKRSHTSAANITILIQYKDLFVTDENPRLGYTELVKHNICLKPDFKPKHQQPYRLSPDKKNVLRDHLDELLKQGIISPVQETEDIPITSPIVLVSKRTRPQSKNNSINKSTSLSQFRFCCDFSSDRRNVHSHKVLAFSWTSDIKDGTQPPADRVSAVLDMPSPTSVKDLRRAIGLFNWFRKYIQNFSAEVDPMTKLLKKSVKFKWGIEQEQAFKKVKTLLVNSPVLAFPTYDLPFYLAVDTSCKGIGYCCISVC